MPQPLEKISKVPMALRTRLRQLSIKFGLLAVKAGTEVEDMTFAEIQALHQITRGIVPLYVKIGGPEARTDMRKCLNMEVEGIIAPMVESAFALKKFIVSLQDIASEKQLASIRLGINIETKTALENLDEILSSEYVMHLHQVTAARSDLSDSLGCTPDDPEVIELCERIVEYARYIGVETSIGGKIMPDSVENLLNQIKSDRINTRHMLLDCSLIAKQAAQAVNEALLFEIGLYRLFADLFAQRRKLHLSRVKQLERRLQKSPLLQN